jgi:ATP-dependent Clp protease protease subunit
MFERLGEILKNKKKYKIMNIEKDFKLYANSKGITSTTLHDYKKYQDKIFVPQAGYMNPTILEERQLHVTQIDVFSRMLMDRVVWFNGDVTTDTCNIVNSQLMYLDSISNDEIKLQISSNGGAVSAGLSTKDIMDYCISNISTYCIGMCASMGAIILTSGTKGKRYILPHGEVLLHQPIGGTDRVQASDIVIIADHIQRTKKKIYDILVEATGQSYEQIEKDCDRDFILDSDAAVLYGVVDEVIRRK